MCPLRERLSIGSGILNFATENEKEKNVRGIHYKPERLIIKYGH